MTEPRNTDATFEFEGRTYRLTYVGDLIWDVYDGEQRLGSMERVEVADPLVTPRVVMMPPTELPV